MRKTKVLTIASLLLIGSSSLAFAGPHHGGPGPKGGPHGGPMMHMDHRGGHMGMFKGLDLTQEQQQKMRDIMAQHRDAQVQRPMHEPMDGNLYGLITADQFDEAQVRKQIEENAKFHIDRQVEMAKVHHDLYQVLTPEQKAKAKSFHEQRMEKLKQRIDARANNAPVRP